MADPHVPSRLAALEADNAWLRRLLDGVGMGEALRHGLHDTLAMMRAVLRQSSETATEVDSFVAHLEGRFDTVIRVRANIDTFGEADLHHLVSDELLFHLVREGDQAAIDGPRIRLVQKAAQVFALAVHELATNAVEHGPLRAPCGRVRVTWHTEDDATAGPSGLALVFVWVESGGSALPPPARRGFGRTVIEETLAYELKARTDLTFGSEGLRCIVRFPLLPRIGRVAEAGVRAVDGSDMPGIV